jgi:D-sedoheptulose 7-phosphate isomerase
LLFGNGGSAADATHLAAELVGRYKLERDALPALSLSDNNSSITAIGNDYAYDVTFARQIQAFGREGDVAIGLSTSGRSVNVLRGLQAASELGLQTVAITGAAGPVLEGEAPHIGEGVDLWLAMPTDDTPRIQECTMLVGHTICELVERAVVAE